MKPTFNFAIICDHAFVDQGNRLTIIQIYDEIKAKSFPAIHPRLTVVTNYISEKKDSTKELTHLVSIFDPDGEKIAALPIKRTGMEEKTQFITSFNGLIFKKSGSYNIEIELNKKTVKNLPLKVTKI